MQPVSYSPIHSGEAAAISPALLYRIIQEWEQARTAYAAFLRLDTDWSDEALSRNSDYNRLLHAGLALCQFSGRQDLRQVAEALAKACTGGSTQHFEHRWRGLLKGDSATVQRHN